MEKLVLKFTRDFLYFQNTFYKLKRRPFVLQSLVLYKWILK